MWISNSDIAGVFYVFANTDPSKVKNFIYSLHICIIIIIYKFRHFYILANYYSRYLLST